jgi:LSD1 subclass zinc finger protein
MTTLELDWEDAKWLVAPVRCRLIQWPVGRKRWVEVGMGRRMGIPKELLEILVCPICKTPVKLTPGNSGLKCATCRRVYPVRDDIPVMLPEEAKIEGEN